MRVERVGDLAHVLLVGADRGDQVGLAAAGPASCSTQVLRRRAAPGWRPCRASGSMACAASPTSVTRDGSQRLGRHEEAERDHEDRLQLHPADESPRRPGASRRPRAASSRASAGASRRSTRRDGGTTVPGATLQLTITYGADRVERDVGRDVRRRLVHRPPRVEGADQQPRARPVDGDQHAVRSGSAGACSRSSGVSGVRP